MKNYAHVLARIFNTPHLVAPDKAGVIVAALSERLGVSARATNADAVSDLSVWARKYPDGRVPSEKIAPANPYAVTEQGIAVISVEGLLAHCAATAAPPSGMMTYSDLELQLEHAMRDPNVRGILLDIDSPGGEGSESVWTVAGRILDARKVKPIWAVADECAASAAYLIASAASRLYVPEAGYVGSIGALTLHLDESGRDEKEGLVWTYVFAGAHKIDGNSHEPLPDSVRARMQARIDAAYERFVTFVGQARPELGVEGARASEANIYTGGEAVKLGLADVAGDFRTALADFAAFLDKPRAAASSPLAPRAAFAAGSDGPELFIPFKTTESAAAPASAGNAEPAKPEAVAAAAPSNQETIVMPEPKQGAAGALDAAVLAALAGFTADDLRTHCSTAVGQIMTAAATAERDRILGIEQYAMPGHEDLVATLKADGKTSPDMAAAQILKAEKAKNGAVLKKLQAEEPKQPPAAAVTAQGGGAPAPSADGDVSDTALKAKWEGSADTRAEFASFEQYAAFAKAEANGQVKRLRSRAG